MTQTIEGILDHIEQSDELLWMDWLELALETYGCTTGTIHVLEKDTAILKLKAQVGVPDFLLPKMSEVPIGKGMAGIAAERRKAVQVCNLQTDESGVVRPEAKDTKVEGAITVPLMLDGELYGTLGVAKREPYEFSDEEVSGLERIAAAISKKIKA